MTALFYYLKGFYTYVYTKHKYRNPLKSESDLRIQLPHIDPNKSDLVSKKQHRLSY